MHKVLVVIGVILLFGVWPLTTHWLAFVAGWLVVIAAMLIPGFTWPSKEEEESD